MRGSAPDSKNQTNKELYLATNQYASQAGIEKNNGSTARIDP